MEQSLRRLYALGPGRMLHGRERLARVLEHCGNPHQAVPAILVGGTNGKGSLTTALSAVLSRKLRCGAFIKPHLKTVRERWRLNDQTISAELFERYAGEALDAIEASGEEISFFEANVLLGTLLYRGEGCEAAIWEVGLGGTHDACNLIDAEVSAITNVGYDHQAILGNTLSEIATDKAGIARSGRPLILGAARAGWEPDYAEYAPVVERTAMEAGAEFIALQPAAPAAPCKHERLQPDTLQMLQAVLQRFEPAAGLDAADVARGLAAWHYRGRLERTRLMDRPVLLDAAHNADSLRWLRLSLQRMAAEQGLEARYPIVFGCQNTREPIEMLRELAPVIAVLTPVEVPVLRPCPLARIVAAAEELGLPVALPPGVSIDSLPREYEIGHVTELDPPDNRTYWIECVMQGLNLGSEELPAVICGSIYNLGEILRIFEDYLQPRMAPA